MVAALAHRHIQSQRDGVGERQLDLAMISARPEDAHIRNDALPGTDDGDRFLGRKEAILVQPFGRLELVAFAKVIGD